MCVKAIGENKTLLFIKINFGFYIKASSTNYMQVFIELKKVY